MSKRRTLKIDWQQVDRWLIGEEWIGSLINTHISKLCRDIGPRWSGSAEEEMAVAYVIEQFISSGLLDPRIEEFELHSWEHGPDKASIVESGHNPVIQPLLNCPAVNISGRIVNVGHGMENQLKAAGPLLKGAIAVLDLGYEPFSVPSPLPERLRTLSNAGATAAIVIEGKSGGRLEYRHATDKRWDNAAGTVLPHPIPTVLTSREDGAILRVSEGNILKLKVQGKSYKTTGYNTVADLKGDLDSEETILVGAHHDTVLNSPGGNDNASGTAVVLECSRLLGILSQKLDIRPGCNIRFATWGAEEQNHQGSAAYIRRHHGPEPIPRFVINLDELATGPIKGVVLQFPHLRPLVQSTLDSMGDGLRCYVLDHVDPSADSFSFARAAIPTAILWRWRFVGRHPDADYHHEPGDTADKVRTNELREYAWQLARLLLRLSHVTEADWPTSPLKIDEIETRIGQETGGVGRTM